MVIAYLMFVNRESRLDAQWKTRQARSIISPNHSFIKQLDLWERLDMNLEERQFSNEEQRQAFEEYKTSFSKRSSTTEY